jgi:hypothetical protein
MWYGCDCGHRERIWNARDGVTPFATLCPSCNQPNLRHVNWERDKCAPGHKPAHGQRVWISMTRERAEALATARIEAGRKACYVPSDGLFDVLVEDFYRDGAAPDMAVTGYAQAPSV